MDTVSKFLVANASQAKLPSGAGKPNLAWRGEQDMLVRQAPLCTLPSSNFGYNQGIQKSTDGK
jgi:hypothetical protein